MPKKLREKINIRLKLRIENLDCFARKDTTMGVALNFYFLIKGLKIN